MTQMTTLPISKTLRKVQQTMSLLTYLGRILMTSTLYDFGTVSSTSGTTAGGAPINNANASSFPGQAPAAPNNQDWEALFSGFDSPSDVPTKNNEENKSPVQSQSSGRPSTAGRALSDEGKHDDPIVKNLTGMGYSRTDAVNALEKYDYNLERV
ncbi:hypothetical protein F4774DRAFT_48524 [Daldinia eschscholtzii]|nr:hypothetical protein F4774DRAFT_48524 [Daldinia eschscholtzii]